MNRFALGSQALEIIGDAKFRGVVCFQWVDHHLVSRKLRKPNRPALMSCVGRFGLQFWKTVVHARRVVKKKSTVLRGQEPGPGEMTNSRPTLKNRRVNVVGAAKKEWRR
jgi:hypothetical protein